ncbi:MAG TPA: flagellar hook capping FlgD N-terminal domain-containing protein [Burkholderiaceae bacterium]
MPADTVGQAAGVARNPGIGQDEFLKLLLTQLQNQNPLKPVDNTQFVAQMAQFSALAQTQQIGESVNGLLTNQAAGHSVSLLGKTVDATLNGQQLTGEVTGVTFNSTGGAPQPMLTIRVSSINMSATLSQISAVRP